MEEELKKKEELEKEELEKKPKKKGFTLIELLAVVVILAIIALIAIPLVMDLLYKARKSAAEDSTYGIAETVTNYVSQTMLKNGGNFTNAELVFDCNTNEKKCILDEPSIEELNSNGVTAFSEEIEYKGARVKGGKVYIKNAGKEVVIDALKVNEFTCYYNLDPHTEPEKAKCEKGNGSTNSTTSSTTSTTQPTTVPTTTQPTQPTETGSDETGSTETGSEETGSEETGSDETGSDETGSEETASN